MNRVPTFHGPASIAFLVMLAGLALIYWSLSGFGVITGKTPQERYESTVKSIRE
jgi:hypothetical protein